MTGTKAPIKPNSSAVTAKLRQIGLISGMTRGEYSLTDAGRDWLESGRVVERRGPSERRTRTARGLRVRAWWLMRQLGRWTLPDLLTTLADGSQRTPQSNMLRYLNDKGCWQLKSEHGKLKTLAYKELGKFLTSALQDRLNRSDYATAARSALRFHNPSASLNGSRAATVF